MNLLKYLKEIVNNILRNYVQQLGILTDISLSELRPLFVRLLNLPIRPFFFFRGPRGMSLCVDPPDKRESNRESKLESRTIPPSSESMDCIEETLPSS